MTLDRAATLWALSRRTLALLALAVVLWLGVFGPLGALGEPQAIDLSQIEAPQLFLLHFFFLLSLAVWYVLGFAIPGSGGSDPGTRTLSVQFGLRRSGVLRELGVGVIAGIGSWFLVVVCLIGLAGLIWALGGEELLPGEPPEFVPWVVSLPLWIRAAVSLSAGVVEETFFRGFLQPRIGIGLSSILFVLAHLSYEQPFMLVGVMLLSLVFALLVRWRQSIWAAIAAHAVFDAIQLLIVMPILLDYLPDEGSRSGLLALAVGAA